MSGTSAARRASLRALLVLALAGRAGAQAVEASGITLVIPAPEGGTADRVGRRIAARLSEILEARIPVRNAPGLNGAVGTKAIKEAAPDGQTFGLAISTAMVASRLLSKAGVDYQPLEDFEWFAVIGSYPSALVIPGSDTVADFKAWIDRAQKASRPMTVGTFGAGSVGQLATAFLQLEQRASLVARPMESLSEGYRALTAGTLDALFDGASTAISEAPRTGNRILAVTGLQRVAALPQVPAFGEIWPGQAFTVWIGLVAPKGFPHAVYSRLAAAIGVLVLEPRHVEGMQSEGLSVIGVTGARARAYVEDDIVRMARLIARLPEQR